MNNNKENISTEDNKTFLELNKLKQEIMDANQFEDFKDTKLQSAIEHKDIKQTLASLFDIITDSIWSQPEEAFWFKNIQKSSYYHLLIETIYELSPEQLSKYTNQFQKEIDQTDKIRQKLLLTYIKSLCLDMITIKSQSPEITTTHIQRMAQHIQPGDIILINKSKKNFADKLLLKYDTTSIDVSHAILVRDVNKQTGDITINHSTWHKINGGSWVETKVSFQDYAHQFKNLGIAVVRPPQELVPDLIQNTDNKDGKWFDYLAAIDDKVTYNHEDNKYNCVELIAQSFPKEKVPEYWRQWTLPSDILKTFQSVYITYTP